VGFIHGVMNTDNVALSGETIDYGPCAFMDAYDPDTSFSSIDHRKRYAYGNQARIAQWNMARFAETLLPLLHPDEKVALEQADSVVQSFPDRFQQHWLEGMRVKLGLHTAEAGDGDLAQGLLDWMQAARADYTRTFLALTSEEAMRTPPFVGGEFHLWHEQWRARLGRQSQAASECVELMRGRNPVVIPRNHKVEEALAAASDQEDLNPLRRLLTALGAPYDHTVSVPAEFTEPANADGEPYRTFCGT